MVKYDHYLFLQGKENEPVEGTQDHPEQRLARSSATPAPETGPTSID
jgi:hypothetical protein